MNLNQFPEAIHAAQHNLLEAGQRLRQLQAVVEQLNAKVDYQIAFDVDLKNDAQRKARRIELTANPQYCEAVACLQAAKDRLTDLEIDYQLLADRFSVAKLEKRELIVRMELQASAA